MNSSFLQLKNYLYTKTKVKYILPFLAIFIFTSCKSKIGGPTYDMPPTPPIPPEKYCFEGVLGNGHDISRLELNVEGDTVYGKVDYAKSDSTPSGTFKGVMYGTTLIIKYVFKSDTGVVNQDQEWNLDKDNISRKITKQIPDSVSRGKRIVSRFFVSAPLHKVPCK
jgi:hypothetical protein